MGLREKIAEAIFKHGRPHGDWAAYNDQGNHLACADAVMEVVEGRDAAVRELHQPYTVTDNPMDLCRTCDTIHPCPTVRALGEDT